MWKIQSVIVMIYPLLLLWKCVYSHFQSVMFLTCFTKSFDMGAYFLRLKNKGTCSYGRYQYSKPGLLKWRPMGHIWPAYQPFLFGPLSPSNCIGLYRSFDPQISLNCLWPLLASCHIQLGTPALSWLVCYGCRFTHSKVSPEVDQCDNIVLVIGQDFKKSYYIIFLRNAMLLHVELYCLGINWGMGA